MSSALRNPATAWFRSISYQETQAVLWWAILPDYALHIAAELSDRYESTDDLARDIRTTTKALQIPQVRYTVGLLSDMRGKVSDDFTGETRGDTFRKLGISIRESAHDPIQGWSRVKDLLKPRPDHRPWLTIAPNCVTLIRALGSAVKDKTDPQDIAVTKDADILRALRIGAMSRPTPMMGAKPPLGKNTVGYLIEELRAASRGIRSTLAWR